MKHLWKAIYYVDLEQHKTKKHIVTDFTSVKSLTTKIKSQHDCVKINLIKAVYLGEVEV